MKEFTVQLDFFSFLKMSLLIGFCFGVGSVPLLILFNYGQLGLGSAPIFAFGAPIAGLFNGFLAGLVGFPLYYWLGQGVGFKLAGNLYVGENQ
ncbi:MAG: hypothetical protein U5L08_00805 [Xanthomonadales bacterium]|nr:hypothetical protein [Xanthomonadales bacterium]